MMSGLRILITLALGVAIVLPRDLGAQDLDRPAHRTFSTPALDALAAPPQDVEGSDWPRQLLAGLSGAAVGVGLGFFASHLWVGDWDEEGTSPNRGLWMGAGGAVGLAVGFAIGPPPRLPEGAGPPRWAREPERAVLTTEEIRSSAARTAYELIEARRPEWLVLRGATNWEEVGESRIPRTHGTPPERAADDETVRLRVYMDDVFLGGVVELRTVDPSEIASIHRLTSSQATVRWGAGHADGAILIITF